MLELPPLDPLYVGDLLKGAWDETQGATCAVCKVAFTFKAALHPRLFHGTNYDLQRLARMLNETVHTVSETLTPYTERSRSSSLGLMRSLSGNLGEVPAEGQRNVDLPGIGRAALLAGGRETV